MNLHSKRWVLATILVIICGVCIIIWCSKSGGNLSDNSEKNVRIAIAWRADTDNEFCTNMVEAFKAVGVDVVVLPQVKASYVSYDGTQVSASCLDSAGIGYLNHEYGAMIRSRGYEDSNIAEVMKGVQGVVFTGGEDISPTLYAVQEDWHHVESDIDYNAARDISDYLTMAYCLDHDIPLLGFCRGAQMLGVISGATMIQDIPKWFSEQGLPYSYEHRREKGAGETYRDYTPHDVMLIDGSLLSRYFGTTTLSDCPSWHHQALLSTEGTPLRVTATTTVSGIDMIEGVERTDKRCAAGVQFHPEAAITKHIGKAVNSANADQFMTYDAAISLFRAFIEACKKTTVCCPAEPDYSDSTQWYVTDRRAAADVFYIISTETGDYPLPNGKVGHWADTYNDSLRVPLYGEMLGVDTLLSGRLNYFSPYYRQCSLQTFLSDSLAAARMPIALGDVRRAFRYYMENLNGGRPFILAGFSQGARIMLELLKEMDNDTFGRMIAAYAIGIAITETGSHLIPAKRADDTGVTICYNSVRDTSCALKGQPQSCMSINPVNWRTDSTRASLITEPSPLLPVAEQRKDTMTVHLDTASRLLIVEGYTAQDYMLPLLGTEGNYHTREIWLYRDQLRENMALRASRKLRGN